MKPLDYWIAGLLVLTVVFFAVGLVGANRWATALSIGFGCAIFAAVWRKIELRDRSQ